MCHQADKCLCFQSILISKEALGLPSLRSRYGAALSIAYMSRLLFFESTLGLPSSGSGKKTALSARSYESMLSRFFEEVSGLLSPGSDMDLHSRLALMSRCQVSLEKL